MNQEEFANQKLQRKQEHEKTIADELDAIKRLSHAEKEIKNKDVVAMITYYDRLTEAVEERRNQLHSHTLQLLAISVTGFGFLFSQYSSIHNQWGNPGDVFIFYPLQLVLLALVVSSFVAIFYYERQNGFRYPFLTLGALGSNKWKWFYYGNPYIQRIKANPIFPSTKPEETTDPYLRGLQEFLHNYKIEDIDRELSDNVQQLYLLQVHNYYKNSWYLQLVSVRTRSMYLASGILVLAAIMFVLNLIFNFVK